VELCAALDGSGSIVLWGQATDFSDQLEGLALAVEDEDIIPTNGSVSITVVHFGAWAEIAVPLTLIENDTVADLIADDIRAIQPLENDFNFLHGTNLIDVIEVCMGQFSGTTEEKIIDISTDGRHSLPFTDPGSDIDDVLAARGAAVQAGLDTLNAIGVANANMDELAEIVWPQPASAPPDDGFVVYAANFTDYKEAMREKVRTEVLLTVALDIKPRSCPNSFNREKGGLLPVAVLGGPRLDVLEIDPMSLLLEGVAPLRWNYEDTAGHPGVTGPETSCLDCAEEGPDGFLDLTMKFNAGEIAALLSDEEADSCFLLTLTGSLMEAFGGRELTGDDTLRLAK